jgi:hypothetical protein
VADTQCPWKSETGRTCKIPLDPETGKHEGQHKTAIRRTDKPVLPGDVALKAEIVPAGKGLRKQVTRTAKPRDKNQLQVDRDAKLNYEHWVKSGKPDDFNNAPHGRYVVPPKAVEATLDLLRAVVTNGGPLPGKRFNYRKGTHPSGNTAIDFLFWDKHTAEKK